MVETPQELEWATFLYYSIRSSQKRYKALTVLVSDRISVPEHKSVFDQLIVVSTKRDNGSMLCYKNSPYDKTIMVKPNMAFPVSIHDWWELLDGNPIVMPEAVVDHRGNMVEPESELVTHFNDMIYFEKSKNAETLLSTADEIYENWTNYVDAVLGVPTPVAQDTVISFAAKTVAHYQPDYSWFTYAHTGECFSRIDHRWSWDSQINSWVSVIGSLVVGQHIQNYPVLITDEDFYTRNKLKQMKALNRPISISGATS